MNLKRKLLKLELDKILNDINRGLMELLPHVKEDQKCIKKNILNQEFIQLKDYNSIYDAIDGLEELIEILK